MLSPTTPPCSQNKFGDVLETSGRQADGFVECAESPKKEMPVTAGTGGTGNCSDEAILAKVRAVTEELAAAVRELIDKSDYQGKILTDLNSILPICLTTADLPADMLLLEEPQLPVAADRRFPLLGRNSEGCKRRDALESSRRSLASEREAALRAAALGPQVQQQLATLPAGHTCFTLCEPRRTEREQWSLPENQLGLGGALSPHSTVT